jgi:hypothetical protein
MRYCAAYHLDYKLAYKDVNKSTIIRIIEKVILKNYIMLQTSILVILI